MFHGPEQSGFKSSKSTTEWILSLHFVVNNNLGELAANVDLKKAFDSLDREALWNILWV